TYNRDSPQWHPYPRRIIGFAHRMVQLDRFTHEFQHLHAAIGQVGRDVGRFGEQSRWSLDPELQPIDVRLPSFGASVAPKSAGPILVGPDSGSRIASQCRIPDEGGGAKCVIGVAMGVNDERDGLVGYLPNCGDRHFTYLPRAGVDRDHVAASVSESDVRKAMEHRETGLDNFELTHHRIKRV